MADVERLVRVDVDKLIPYVNNAKEHSEDQITKIASSIREFGFLNPVLIDKDHNIIAGHGRILAAKKLGMKDCPCVYAEGLTEAQRKAYILADNRLGDLAEWNMEMVASELDALQDLDFDTDLTGFDIDLDIDGYRKPFDVEQDEVPEEAQPKAKRGDIYMLGDHRLMCGSSTDKNDVEMLMDGNQACMLFTSPPYSDMREYEGGKDLSTDSLSNFIMLYRPFTEYQCINLGIKRKDGEVVTYWDDYISKAHEAGYKLLSWNIWDKGSAGSISAERAFVPIYHEFMFMFGAGACEITHEWMMVFGTKFFDIHRTVKKKDDSIQKKSKRRTYRLPDGTMSDHSSGDMSRSYKQMGSVIFANPDSSSHEHPATFPVELPSAYIQAFTNRQDIVIEPFSGSGTTMIACEQTERRCFGMELEPKYVDLAIRRWEEFTGKKAVLINR